MVWTATDHIDELVFYRCATDRAGAATLRRLYITLGERIDLQQSGGWAGFARVRQQGSE